MNITNTDITKETDAKSATIKLLSLAGGHLANFHAGRFYVRRHRHVLPTKWPIGYIELRGMPPDAKNRKLTMNFYKHDGECAATGLAMDGHNLHEEEPYCI